MTPVCQTKWAVKDKDGNFVQRGNCFSAVIATLLDLPISEVPNVETLYDLTGANELLWLDVMDKWLEHMGYELVNADHIEKLFHGEKINKMAVLIHSAGPGNYYLCSGLSSRGVLHECIYKAGQLVWDPYPSREGLMSITNYRQLIKLKCKE